MTVGHFVRWLASRAADYGVPMQAREPWVRHGRRKLMQRRFFTVVSDEVSHPGGADLEYDWILAADMVRVAATTDAGELLIIE